MPHRADHDIASTDDLAPAPRGPGGAPGKSTLTSRLWRSPRRDDRGVAPGAEDAVAQLGGGGAPLPAGVRDRFEASLGADLGAVRIHTDDASATAADAVGARAFARGNDIHFGAGQYQPDDPFGMHLLAHEVAHTVQQSGGATTTQYKLAVSSPGDAAEVEADRAADAMVRGEAASVGAIGGSAAGNQLSRAPQPGAAVGAPGGPAPAPGQSKLVLDLAEWKPKEDQKLGPFKFNGSAKCAAELTPPGAAKEGVKEVGMSAEKVKASAEKKIKGFSIEPTLAGEAELGPKGIKVNVGFKAKLGDGGEFAGFEIPPPEARFIPLEFKEGHLNLGVVELKTSILSPVLGKLEGYDVRLKGQLKLTVQPDYAEIMKYLAQRLLPALGLEGGLAIAGLGSILTLAYAWAKSTQAPDIADELAVGCYDYCNGYAAGLRSEKMPPARGKTKDRLVAGHIKGTDDLVARASSAGVATGAIAAIFKSQVSLAPDLWEKNWPAIRANAIADWEADWTKYNDVKAFKRSVGAYTYSTIATNGKA